MVRALSAKVVVRGLPPKLRADDFIRIVDPLPSHTYFRFCGADDSLGGLGLTRVYITFNDMDSLFDFKERFDGYIFLDCEGNESSALVEFAVCQALACAKGSSDDNGGGKVDKKQGSLLKDSVYVKFLNSQSAEVCAEVSESESKKTPWESILDDLQNKEANALQTQTVTPLLTYLNNRGGDIRRKDEESSRHRQFRQGNASAIKKTLKVDKSVRSHPPVRRPHDIKRISCDRICEVSNKENPHHNSTEDLTGVDPKMQKNKNSEKLITLDANEFPAMQSSCQRPNRSTNQCSSWPSFRAPNISDATSEKPGASASRSSAIEADSKPFSRISDSSSENRVRINLSEIEGHKSSECATKPTSKELLPKCQNEQILSSQSEPTHNGQNSTPGNAFRTKKGNYFSARPSAFVNQTRKHPIVQSEGRRDSDANMQNYTSASHQVDDQENVFSHERYNNFSKSGIRGRDNRRGTVSSHEVFHNSSRDSYKVSQQMSRESVIRGYDCRGEGDSVRSDHYSDQQNSNARYSGASRNSYLSSKGRVNSVNTTSYRRPGNYASRGRGSGY
ncbi:unnamed protein product [Schistosoma rodhaini]|uniref:UPF3 domain-containing protein n=1 Tax=Schistosoma rodhaini TaxID=6188 RepID=A0AA85FQU4_9TREM|nr:unnamed protein product [Schistosoma rodhaini]